jgi:hypothetical protein
VIRDIAEFSRSGVACRRIDELDVPVEAWRAAMSHAGRREGVRVRTFLIPRTPPDAGRGGQLVFAVRTDPLPDPAMQRQGLLRWWRTAELGMPFERWRAALRRVARREGALVRTFLVPHPVAHRGDRADQLVFAVWTDATDPAQPTAPRSTACSSTRPEPLPVTDLAVYAADRSRRAASIARHPSTSGDRPAGGGDADR